MLLYIYFNLFNSESYSNESSSEENKFLSDLIVKKLNIDNCSIKEITDQQPKKINESKITKRNYNINIVIKKILIEKKRKNERLANIETIINRTKKKYYSNCSKISKINKLLKGYEKFQFSDVALPASLYNKFLDHYKK